MTLAHSAAAGASTLPPGYDDQPVADVASATAFGFTPDDRILITTQTGQVRVVKNGALLPDPALDLGALDRVCTNLERGLLGVAVDPGFSDSHYVYLYYTDKNGSQCPSYPETGPFNRLSRFVLGDDDTIDPASETILLDHIPSPYGVHNAGDLQFGKDGYLYVSVGDGGCDGSGQSACGGGNWAARYRNVLSGKILRIESDGSIPPDNPFTGSGTARCNATGQTAPGQMCQEIWASGLRNPFRLAMNPNVPGTDMYINDVGQDNWEEIDRGQAGADYGWPEREGPCTIGSTSNCGPPPAGLTNPIYAYDHSSGCTAITGGAFVPQNVWPSQYDDNYLFVDLVCGKLFQLIPDGTGGFTSTEFGMAEGALVGVGFGPTPDTGALLPGVGGSARRGPSPHRLHGHREPLAEGEHRARAPPTARSRWRSTSTRDRAVIQTRTR